MIYYGSREDMQKQQAKQYTELDSKWREQFEKEHPRKEIDQKEDISGSKFTDIHKQAQAFADKWNKSIKDVYLDHSGYEYEYGGGITSEAHLEVKGLENDEQYYSRLWEYYEAEQRREKHEREVYERLRTKFGP